MPTRANFIKCPLCVIAKAAGTIEENKQTNKSTKTKSQKHKNKDKQANKPPNKLNQKPLCNSCSLRRFVMAMTKYRQT